MVTTHWEAEVLRNLRQHIVEHGMEQRGADGTDFQFAGDRSLYFRTGYVRGEVAIRPYRNEVPINAIRITNPDQVAEAKHQVDAVIERWRNRREVRA